jgi:hypothetical protein
MGIGDFADTAKDALNSDAAAQFKDQGVDKAADAADKATGGKFSDQIQQGRDALSSDNGPSDAGREGQERDDRQGRR